MNALAPLMIAAAGAIFLALGAVHVVITYAGRLLTPREPGLRERMQGSAPVISRGTTMWQAWLGFNASHGLGAMVFGAVYMELALADWTFFAHETLLQALGLAAVAAWVVLALGHWFRLPQAGIALAALLYAGGLVALRA